MEVLLLLDIVHDAIRKLELEQKKGEIEIFIDDCLEKAKIEIKELITPAISEYDTAQRPSRDVAFALVGIYFNRLHYDSGAGVLNEMIRLLRRMET